MVTRALALSLVLLSCGGAMPSTCPNDLPKTCPTPVPSYASEISTLFLAHCVMCHQANGVMSSIPLDTYAGVYAARSAVLDQVYACKMPQPPQPSLTDTERESLLGWLVCNAPQN